MKPNVDALWTLGNGGNTAERVKERERKGARARSMEGWHYPEVGKTCGATCQKRLM